MQQGTLESFLIRKYSVIEHYRHINGSPKKTLKNFYRLRCLKNVIFMLFSVFQHVVTDCRFPPQSFRSQFKSEQSKEKSMRRSINMKNDI